MTRQMKASLHEVSKQYVQRQVQHLGGPVKRRDLNNAIKKVSKVLEELETARLKTRGHA
jgi:hypothetical protein